MLLNTQMLVLSGKRVSGGTHCVLAYLYMIFLYIVLCCPYGGLNGDFVYLPQLSDDVYSLSLIHI